MSERPEDLRKITTSDDPEVIRQQMAATFMSPQIHPRIRQMAARADKIAAQRSSVDSNWKRVRVHYNLERRLNELSADRPDITIDEFLDIIYADAKANPKPLL